MRDRLTREHHRGGAVGEHAGRLHDVVRRNAGFLFNILGREGFAVFDELFIARAPLVDELALYESFLHEDADHAPGKRAVGAGLYLQVNVGLFGNLRAARIGDDELQAARLLREEIPEEPVGRGPGAVLADDHAALRLRARTARDFSAVGKLKRMHVGEVAGHRAFAAVIGAAEIARETHDGWTGLLRVAAVKEHAVGAVLFLHGIELLGDRLDRLVPADAHPARICRTLGRRALHGVKESIGVVEPLERRNALRAEEVIRMFVPVFNADHGIAARLEMDAAHRHMVAGIADGPAGPVGLRFLRGCCTDSRLEKRGGKARARTLHQGAA